MTVKSAQKKSFVQISKTLAMSRSPQEEAAHLIHLYKEEASQIAEDCITLFHDAGEPDHAAYWHQVYGCIHPDMTKH